MRPVLITGGAGFIGSEAVRQLVSDGEAVVNLDKLTYAGNLDSLTSVAVAPGYCFERADVCDAAAVAALFDRHRPRAVVHLAAESHVDRSIDGSAEFIRTNIVGTHVVLEESLRYWRALPPADRERFRVLHVSTDEVFGSLGTTGAFTEHSSYDPRSPYSASKAGSDHLVRAWHHTYGLPVLISNCSNNYGSHQFPEKLIPLMIIKASSCEALPVYGAGDNVRDWLHVSDHVRALRVILERGRPGESYNIGGGAELRNIEVVERICDLVDELSPSTEHRPRRQLIRFVEDRPGHDFRYAMDSAKIQRELGWAPRETFDTGLRKTVEWYLANATWWQRIRSGKYRGERLGLGTEPGDDTSSSG